jgi:hypothetical protein
LLNNPRQRPAKNPNPGADDAQAKHNPTEIPHLPSPDENRPPQVVDGNIWIPYQKVTKENYKSFMKS